MTSFRSCEPLSGSGPLFDFPPLSPTDFSEGSDYGSSPFEFDISPEPWLPTDPNPFGDFAPSQVPQHDSACIVHGFDTPGFLMNPAPPQGNPPTFPDQMQTTTPTPIPPISPTQLPPTSPPPSSPIPTSPLPTSPVSPISPVSPVPMSPASPNSLSPVPISLAPVSSPPPSFPPTSPIPISPPNQVAPGDSHPLTSQAPPTPVQVKKEKRKRKRNDSPPTSSLAEIPPAQMSSSNSGSRIHLTQDQLRTMTSEEYALYVDHLKATQGLSSSDKKEVQRQKRLIRNREYAQKKRRSNKEKSQSINQTVETQQSAIFTLQDENSYLKSELHRLKSMLACILPPQQHHIIETKEPVLPIHANPTKKRRTVETEPVHPSSSASQTVLFVFLLCFGVTLSTVFFLPDGVVSSSLRGAGRGLLSESSSLSYPLGKVKEIFWPVVETEAEKTISTVDSSGLESANLKHDVLPKPQEETSNDPFPGSESHHYMCDGMIEEVMVNITTNETSVSSMEVPEVAD